ncbi:MAG: GntR family transcriptional regulator [Deltaproteobacteria bacterium]|jgi:GntR family transcriptional regulator|nr:GntR family transcriptional regulator [Deltaproteobacteria bacterium]
MSFSDKQQPQAPLPGEREIPQYRRLADLVRSRVADGTYRPGERIPSETAFAKSTGLSFLTVRQALKILVDEGLLERYPGRGTFVTGLNWRRAPFWIVPSDPGLAREDFCCELIHISVERASAADAGRLAVPPGTLLAFMRHSFRLPGKPPFMTDEGKVLLDPYRPLIEARLSASFLTGLLQGGAQGLLKRASLTAAPASLTGPQASALGRREGDPAWRLEYLFFDASSRPVATGFYLAPPDALSVAADLGLPLGSRTTDAAAGPPLPELPADSAPDSAGSESGTASLASASGLNAGGSMSEPSGKGPYDA